MAGGIEGEPCGRNSDLISRLLAAVILWTCCPAAAVAHWIADVDAGLLHDSNLNNAQLKSDIRSDTALSAAFSVGQFVQLTPSDSLTVTANAKAETYQHFSGMNNVSAGITIAVRRKLAVGAEAPWLRLSTSAARLDFQNSVRDGWLLRAAMAAGKRLSERWELQAEYSNEKRTGDNAVRTVAALPGDVFDVMSHAVSLDVRFSVTEKTLVFAGYVWREGDVVSTSAPNAKIFAASTALTRDPAFGTAARAYRLDAVTRIASVGVSQAIGPNSALNVSYQRQMTHGDGGNNYFKSILAASYAHVF